MQYRIKPKETIADVMDFFDIPFHLIQRYNPWVKKIEAVYENNILILPYKYTVVPGEKYENIAKHFHVSPEEFWNINCDIGQLGVIYPGETVFLPPEAEKARSAGKNNSFTSDVLQQSIAAYPHQEQMRRNEARRHYRPNWQTPDGYYPVYPPYFPNG
ncbi:LysM domain-containing protein [Evansella caseinilytica]|uniref:LysM domain-containing protein n=1 Tax=Evansella caseinilytica TaxID=1503961 RepID=A0A1H3RHX0_9BACI|nr:LysM domain-containing protein [Evansella caseinilytica]SDZ25287.1 LysM domain-containing protein [Evansella caseinilytica]